MIGPAVLVFLASTGAAWLLRELLLRTLRTRHPAVAAALGAPTGKHLASVLPRHRETQLRFFNYLWSREPFALGDVRVSALVWAVRAADVASGASMALVFWAAWTLGG